MRKIAYIAKLAISKICSRILYGCLLKVAVAPLIPVCSVSLPFSSKAGMVNGLAYYK